MFALACQFVMLFSEGLQDRQTSRSSASGAPHVGACVSCSAFAVQRSTWPAITSPTCISSVNLGASTCLRLWLLAALLPVFARLSQCMARGIF